MAKLSVDRNLVTKPMPEVKLPEVKFEAYYRMLGKGSGLFADQVRTFLETALHKTRGEFRMSGGQSGDMHKETAQLDTYSTECDGFVQLYTVTDDNTSGHSLTVSVINGLVESSPFREVLLDWLRAQEFVTSHSSFRDRPLGEAIKSFKPYLESPYHVAPISPFVNR